MFAKRLLTGNLAQPFLGGRVLGLNGAQQIGLVDMQTREVASLKQLKARMRSITNMMKITKAMKMVAASKLKSDEKRMRIAMPFVRPVQDLFMRLPRDEKPGPVVYFAFTSDKGLCGGVNGSIAKMCRIGMLEEEAKGNTAKYLGIGLKGVGALKRRVGDRFAFTFEQVAKVPWSFATASILAEKLIATNPNKLTVCYNKFKTLIAFETTAAKVVTPHEAKTLDRAEFSKAMDVYSFEPSIYEVWQDLHEFYYATVIHGCYLESVVSEQSSRMSAMENASRNAGDMLEKVSLVYNRARQARITMDLCEIISGAAALRS